MRVLWRMSSACPTMVRVSLAGSGTITTADDRPTATTSTSNDSAMNAETFAPDGLVPADHVGGLTPGTDWNNMDGAKFIANLESYQRYRCCDKFKDGITNFEIVQFTDRMQH